MITEDSPLSKAIRVDIDTIAQGATPLPAYGTYPLLDDFSHRNAWIVTILFFC